MDGQKETGATANSDGTIVKPFLIDGGRFVVEANVTDLENVMFSIRGEIDSKNVPSVFQIAERFLAQIISDSEGLGK